MAILIVLFIVFGGLIAIVISSYNSLVSLRRQTANAFSQIDVQLNRRYDLIPNLVETVKGYMRFEQDTLERVIQARNLALKAATVDEKASAENEVRSALTGIFALSESYIELKANQNMLSLQEELKSTENKISFARQYYNDIVTAYKIKLETFPSSLIAAAGNFPPKELFELEDQSKREPIKVSF